MYTDNTVPTLTVIARCGICQNWIIHSHLSQHIRWSTLLQENIVFCNTLTVKPIHRSRDNGVPAMTALYVAERRVGATEIEARIPRLQRPLWRRYFLTGLSLIWEMIDYQGPHHTLLCFVPRLTMATLLHVAVPHSSPNQSFRGTRWRFLRNHA